MESLTSEEMGDFASLLNARANVVRRILSEFATTHSRSIRGAGWYEPVSIGLHVTCHQRTLIEGDHAEVEVELANVDKATIRLVRLEGAVPAGFELARNPSDFRLEDGSFNLDDTILGPSEKQSIRLTLKGRRQGLFTLSPCIIYRDDQGTERTGQTEPIEIIVSPIMKFLVSSFEEDRALRNLPLAEAGWRSLMDIVEAQNLPRSQVYGDVRRGHTFAKPLENLIEEGLVETRVCPGERGRGGRIVRVRVNLQKERAKKLLKTNTIPG
jgi:hypothetical protein